jgi:hypothetical protein
MSNSFALQEFTIPPRRETRFPLGFSDKSVKKNPLILDALHKSPLFYPKVVLRAGILHACTGRAAETRNSINAGLEAQTLAADRHDGARASAPALMVKPLGAARVVATQRFISRRAGATPAHTTTGNLHPRRALICLKRIYNFLCSMLVFTPFA